MNTITTKDGRQIYFKDCGKGQPIVFSHGWPLSSDAWEDQMFFLASRGFRCIAHDRPGHGRSSQPWEGNDMDNRDGPEVQAATGVKFLLFLIGATLQVRRMRSKSGQSRATISPLAAHD